MSLLFRFLIAFAFLLVLVATFSQDKNDMHDLRDDLLKQYSSIEKIYRQAELIDDEEKQDELNKKALYGFNDLLPRLEKIKDDSLSFYCHLKSGILEHYFGNLAAANKHYNRCISLKTNLPSFSDSIFFKAYLYSGSMYYSQSEFDSALLRFKQAEAITDRFSKGLNEEERLYNNFGVVYYEMGNYRQAKNYFEKAIAVLPVRHIYYEALLVNYKINLAQVLTKLEDYDQAYRIYQDLVNYNISRNEIYHNIGTINLTLGAAKEALAFFQNVHYDDAKVIRLYNDKANAFLNLKQFDSAGYFLRQAGAEHEKRFGNRKTTAHGLTLKYAGDLLNAKGKYKNAAKLYQLAINQFYNDFSDTSVAANPSSFSGIFSYINLFNALTAKASALEQQFREEKKNHLLEMALHAYQSAFHLVDYVQKSYESDEARLFLNKIKYTVHSRPIDVSLELYDLTSEKTYLEEAYRFDQLNKASVLSLSLQETSLQQEAGVSGKIMAGLISARSELTRLSIKAATLTDSAQLKKINDEIREHEIQLAGIQEQLNRNEDYAQLQFSDRIPSSSYLQKKFLDQHTALISYHLSENELLAITITKNGLDYVKQTISPLFFRRVDSLVKSLHDVRGSERYSGAAISRSLYDLLIKPLEGKLMNKNRLIIIPDDELNYLPFEALEDEKSNFLVTSYSIQYQYSTALLHSTVNKKLKKTASLGFAPFTDSVLASSFPILNYSKEEIGSLRGKIFVGKDATKENFMRMANSFSCIHLATHASVNDSLPFQSFIAFYPADSSSHFKLFAREIYGMKLNSTDLVILSACETGAGQLVKGEGLMSLSRAFAYAGCPNIITSLWKAEDKTTAFLAERLHYYLDKGETKDKALRQSKIDLLNSNSIDPNLKTPNYWAHLIFIGNYEKEKSPSPWWWIAGTIIVAATISIILKKSRLRDGTSVS